MHAANGWTGLEAGNESAAAIVGGVSPTLRNSGLAVENQDEVRARIRAEIIGKKPGIKNETDLARVLSKNQEINRSATRDALKGSRSLPTTVLDAIEREFGFALRYYVEKGVPPSEEEQAVEIARLPKDQFRALLDLAASPQIRATIESLSVSPVSVAATGSHDHDLIRERIWEVIITPEPHLNNENNLGTDLGAAQLYDRSAVRKVMRGERGISRGFLDALEQLYGYPKRAYIETGEWPSEQQQAAELARLPKDQFRALLDLAASPAARERAKDLAAGAPAPSPAAESVQDSDGIRERVHSEMIGPGKEYPTDTAFATDLQTRGLFDRGNASKMLRGSRKVTTGLLNAIEAVHGYSKRHSIETGEWPTTEQNVQRLSRLPADQLNRLIELSADPAPDGLSQDLARLDSETVSLLKKLLAGDPEEVKFLLSLITNGKALPFAQLVLGNGKAGEKIRQLKGL